MKNKRKNNSKLTKTYWVAIYIFIMSVSVNQINAQQTILKEKLIEKINAINIDPKIKISDTTYYNLRKEAWSLKEDSLYAELTFQQIEKNKGHIDVSLATTILGDLLREDYDYLKKHPKLLLLCYLNLGRYYLSQYNISKASLGLSKYYFEQYFQILKSIPLNTRELYCTMNTD